MEITRVRRFFRPALSDRLREQHSETSTRSPTHLRTSTGRRHRHTLWPPHRNGVRMKTSPRLALVALLGLVGVLVAPGSPASAVSLPGTVLSSATATLPPELAPLATGKRIQYLTTDVNGSLIPATGLILT